MVVVNYEHTILVSANVYVSIGELEGALAMLLVVLPLTVVATLVHILQHAHSVLGVIMKFPGVHIPSGVAIHSFSILLVVTPQARVYVAAAVAIRPCSLLFACQKRPENISSEINIIKSGYGSILDIRMQHYYLLPSLKSPS